MNIIDQIRRNDRIIKYCKWNPSIRKIRDEQNHSTFTRCFKIVIVLPFIILKYFSFLLPIKEPSKFKYNYAIVAIIKNEGLYIKEWIDYHLLIGVEKIYIYDNESNDNVKDILQPYIDKGIVDYIFYPGKNRQCYAYNDAVEKHRYDVKYIAMIDLDEFIIPMSGESINIVNKYLEKNKHYGGMGMHWFCFGSSGYVTRPDGNVLDNYLYRAKDNFKNNIAIKTIFNPRKVICISNPHYPCYRHGYYNINENCKKISWAVDPEISDTKIRINHYFCKSQEECKAKFARGKADIDGKNSWDVFSEYDKNDVFDTKARDLYNHLAKK